MLRGAIVVQWVRHGPGGCQCQGGHLHGPYHYLFQMEPVRRLRKRYIRKADVPHVRALVERHRAAQSEKRESRREWTETYSQINRHLRDTDRMMKDYLKGNT